MADESDAVNGDDRDLDSEEQQAGTPGDMACGCLGCGMFLLFDVLFALGVLWLLQSCN